jgi:hypothetical protein
MIIRGFLAAAVLASLAACGAPVTESGADLSSTTSTVTWTDGQPAFAITCDLPGACQTRSQALCYNGAYRVLDMQSMPGAGTQYEYLGRPSAVVRCGNS